MHLARYAFLIATLELIGFHSVYSQETNEQKDYFEKAQTICSSWIKSDDEFVNLVFSTRNISKETIKQDFIRLRKVIFEKVEYQKLLKSKADSTGDSSEYLSLIWYEWRINGNTDDVDNAIRTSSNYVKVNIESTPTGATITINGKEKGKTPRPSYLQKGEKTPITLEVAGFPKWEAELTPKDCDPQDYKVDFANKKESLECATTLYCECYCYQDKEVRHALTIRPRLLFRRFVQSTYDPCVPCGLPVIVSESPRSTLGQR